MCLICSLSGKRFKLRWSFDTLHDPLVPRALPQRLPNLRKTQHLSKRLFPSSAPWPNARMLLQKYRVVGKHFTLTIKHRCQRASERNLWWRRCDGHASVNGTHNNNDRARTWRDQIDNHCDYDRKIARELRILHYFRHVQCDALVWYTGAAAGDGNREDDNDDHFSVSITTSPTRVWHGSSQRTPVGDWYSADATQATDEGGLHLLHAGGEGCQEASVRAW